MRYSFCIYCVAFVAITLGSCGVLAHGVDANTERFLLATEGVAIGPFLYIGAKHMLTGYDLSLIHI